MNASNMSIENGILLENDIPLSSSSLMFNLSDKISNSSYIKNPDIHNATNDGSPVCFLYQLDSPAVQLSHKLSTFLCIIIIFVGIVCNILGMIVFCSSTMKRSITSVYLFSLALSDTIYLIMVFLSRMLESIKCLYFPNSSMDIYHRSKLGCKGLQYFLDVFSDFSACIILVVTIERYLACYHPVIYRKHCCVKTAKVICMSLIITLLILNIPHHILFVEHNPDVNICDHSKRYERIFDYIFMTEVTLFRIIPTFAIAVFNTFIIVKLWKRANEKQKRSASDRSSVTSRISNISCVGAMGESNAAINTILVLISTTYIICYQPILICYILSKINSDQLDISMETMVISRNYSRILYIFGYAVNFFFYTLAGRVFRKELRKIIFCRKWRKYGL